MFKLALAHAWLLASSGHAWNSLAVSALAAMVAIPSELLDAHPSLRVSIPILIAMLGTLIHSIGQRAAAVDAVDNRSPS